MNDNYLNETLPRWQFWKEYLIEQLERYTERFEKGDFFCCLSDKKTEEIKKVNTEMIEKIKGIKNRTDFGKIPDEVTKWKDNIKDILDWNDYEYAGVFWEDVTDEYKLSSWLNIGTLACAIYHKTNKEITK